MIRIGFYRLKLEVDAPIKGSPRADRKRVDKACAFGKVYRIVFQQVVAVESESRIRYVQSGDLAEFHGGVGGQKVVSIGRRV